MLGSMLGYLQHGDFESFFIVALVLVVSIAIHEFGHALADELEGDPTARLAGRLTVNPIRHLDPFGTLMIVLVGFGWGKPVPISPNSLRNRRFGAAIVGFAGPITNLILAFVAAALLNQVDRTGLTLGGRILYQFLSLNILLAALNLLPIPPLDGSRILAAVLPPNRQHIVYFLDRYGFAILLVAALFVLPHILPPIQSHAVNLVFRLIGSPLRVA